jgi:hypothetical protein
MLRSPSPSGLTNSPINGMTGSTGKIGQTKPRPLPAKQARSPSADFSND